jgi:hypothetical protein
MLTVNPLKGIPSMSPEVIGQEVVVISEYMSHLTHSLVLGIAVCLAYSISDSVFPNYLAASLAQNLMISTAQFRDR